MRQPFIGDITIFGQVQVDDGGAAQQLFHQGQQDGVINGLDANTGFEAIRNGEVPRTFTKGLPVASRAQAQAGEDSDPKCAGEAIRLS